MKFYTGPIAKSPRIQKLVDALFEKMPRIEADRAVLLTESYKATEGEPIITRRAKAFRHILENIPIIIRENELIVGSATQAPRSCQVFPELFVRVARGRVRHGRAPHGRPVLHIRRDKADALRGI